MDSSKHVFQSPSTPEWVENLIDGISKDFKDLLNPGQVSDLQILSGLLQQPLAEVRAASKPFKSAEMSTLSWAAYLLTTRFLKDHKVGFFKRHLIAQVLNHLLFAALRPEEYRALFAANKKFYATLGKALG